MSPAEWSRFLQEILLMAPVAIGSFFAGMLYGLHVRERRRAGKGR